MVELEEIESPPREPPPQRVEAKEPRSAATESAAGLPSFAAPGAAGRGDEASSASSAVDSGGQAEPSVRSQGSAGPIPGEGLASDWKRGSASTPSGSTAEPQGSQEGTQAAEQDRQAAEEGRGDEEEGEEAFKDAVEGGAAPATVEGALEADGAGDEEAAFTDALTEEELRKSAVAEAEGLKAQGNAAYGRAEYAPAIDLYLKALELAPAHEDSVELRAACHANRAMCLLCVGDYAAAVQACSDALELRPEYVKALMRRAQAYEKLDKLEEALADSQKALELDPGSQVARSSVRRLEPVVAERREKLKEEMIGKLKELGNSILGNFGMSLDNFKAVQDPVTGSYSINFQS